jgi:hypothetical protein
VTKPLASVEVTRSLVPIRWLKMFKCRHHLSNIVQKSSEGIHHLLVEFQLLILDPIEGVIRNSHGVGASGEMGHARFECD